MQTEGPTLHMLCGKIASGKSTLAARLADAPGTVLVSEDDWLKTLFSDELHSLEDYVRCSSKLRSIMGPHLSAVLCAGASVVLDFASNTVRQRAWIHDILANTDISHQLHVLDVPEEICLARLRARNAAGEHPFMVTEDQFHEFSRYFEMPSPGEGFNLVMYQDEAGDPSR